MTITEMRVHIDCAGCEKEIRRALEKVKGVDDVEIDMALQKVTISGWAEEKKLLKIVRRKTGKRAELWNLPFNPEMRNNNFVGHHVINNHNNNMIKHHHHQPSYINYGSYYATQQQPASYYNYNKHGYNYNTHHHYAHAATNNIYTTQTGDAFSDENPHACFVM